MEVDDQETTSVSQPTTTVGEVVNTNMQQLEDMSTTPNSPHGLGECSEEDTMSSSSSSSSSFQANEMENSEPPIKTWTTAIKTDEISEQLENADDNGNALMEDADEELENGHVNHPAEEEVEVPNDIISTETGPVVSGQNHGLKPNSVNSMSSHETGPVVSGQNHGSKRHSVNSMSSQETGPVVSGQNYGSKRNSVNSMSSHGSSSMDNSSSSTHHQKKKKVGHYLLEHTVGKGSYAAVATATHLLTRHKVAVKVVSKRSLVQNEAARHHFRREALILQKLCHPNVIKLYEAMETNNAYYLAFEVAGGGHLLSLVSQKGNLTEEETRTFMKQMISAVDHLHQSDIIHRDIKLENFLLDGNNDLKLVDFGFSTVCHKSDLNTQCGCPVYAAPEVFAGRRYGRPVDIWSLGVCFYGMLLGRLPFLPVSNSLPQLFSIILKGCLIPAHLTPSCQNLLSRMFDPQEERRIAIDEILLHHWLTFPDGQPIRRHRPVPRRLHASSVNQHIVKYMCTSFRFNETDIVKSVTERRLTSSAATYHILKERNESEKWRERTPKTSIALERPSFPESSNTSPPSTFPKITAPPSGVTVSKPISTNGKSDMKIKCSRTGPSASHSGKAQQQSDKLASSNAYKSYILVLKQSRQYGTEALISNHSTTDEMYFDVIRRFPPFVTFDASNSSPIIPHASKSATLTTKTFMRINQNRSVALGVTGKKPSMHDKVADLDLTSQTKFPTTTSLRPRPSTWKSSAPTVPPPPPAPPNSSLGGQHIDRKSSPGVESIDDQSHMPPRILIQNRTTSITGTPPKRNTDSLRPSLSSLRDSFSGDMWSKSRMNIRLRPRPSISLLRSKTMGPSVSLDMQIQGTSPPLIEERERETMDEDFAWQEKSATLEDYPEDEEVMLQNMTHYLDSLTAADASLSRRKDIERKEDSIENVPRSETIASFPLAKKPSNHSHAFPDGMVRTVSIHTSRANYPNFPQSNSPPLYRIADEANARLSQSLDRDEFMTPVTRVTITTKGRDM